VHFVFNLALQWHPRLLAPTLVGCELSIVAGLLVFGCCSWGEFTSATTAGQGNPQMWAGLSARTLIFNAVSTRFLARMTCGPNIPFFFEARGGAEV
jgi:hypothetical protein